MLVRALLSTFILFQYIHQCAQAETSGEQSPHYQVEVIVFENPDRSYGEDADKQHYLKIPTNTIRLEDLTDATPYVMQKNSSAFGLNNIVTRLKGAQKHILFHDAWIQPLSDKYEAQPVRIQGGEESDSPYYGNETILDGTIKISLNRFLHIDTDLQLLQSSSDQYPKSFYLTDSRKLRSHEVHYIDHPTFGVIVKIIPTERPKVALEETLSTSEDSETFNQTS